MGLFRGSLPGRGTGPPPPGYYSTAETPPMPARGRVEALSDVSLLSLRPPPQLRLYKLCPRAFLRAPAQRPAAPAAFGCSGGLDRRSSDFCLGFHSIAPPSIIYMYTASCFWTGLKKIAPGAPLWRGGAFSAFAPHACNRPTEKCQPPLPHPHRSNHPGSLSGTG